MLIYDNKKAGVLTLSIDFYSPHVAQLWLSKLIKFVNFTIKEMDAEEAQKSIEYLNKLIEKTNNQAMVDTFYQLIEEQSQTLMLSEVRQEYVYKVIDPPYLNTDKISPLRALICIGMTILGGVISIIFVFVRHFMFLKQ